MFSWNGGGLPPVSAPNVTVIEPVVAIAKSVVPATGDAGDPFTYTITVSGATATDAYDVTLTDPLPVLMENLVLVSVSDTTGLVTANFDLTGNNLTTVTPWDMPVAVGRQIVLTVIGTVAYAASPGQTIDNVATARWTSLPGLVVGRSLYNTASDERSGAGGVDDYFASNPASAARFTVATVDRAKYLIANSEGHTAEPAPPYHWGLTPKGNSLGLVVGGTALKPTIVEGRIEPREILSLTVMFNHDVIDGAPAARFTRRLVELIESGYGLCEQDIPANHQHRRRMCNHETDSRVAPGFE